MFFFNDTASTEIYTLSLHDALPIYQAAAGGFDRLAHGLAHLVRLAQGGRRDRKSTRLNSSHVRISYAVFCLKKNTLTEAEMVDPDDQRLCTALRLSVCLLPGVLVVD